MYGLKLENPQAQPNCTRSYMYVKQECSANSDTCPNSASDAFNLFAASLEGRNAKALCFCRLFTLERRKRRSLLPKREVFENAIQSVKL